MKRGIRTIEEYWHIFSNFIPQEFRPDLTQVIWMDTSNHNLLAIGQNEKNLTKNMLILSHNLGQYNGEVKSLVLHEFAHILTLNAQQLHVLQDEDITDAQDLLKAMTSD